MIEGACSLVCQYFALMLSPTISIAWLHLHTGRIGSEKDVHAFQEIAKMLNYKIVVEEDLTGKGMCEVMVRADTMVDGSHDSFICFITSH